MKKYYIILPLLLVLAIVTGCGNKDDGINRSQHQEEAENNQMLRWDENFEELDRSYLTIGSQILVMGIANSDGSLLANQIILGDDETDFNQLGRGMMIEVEDEDIDNQVINRDRPNFEQMQDISQEEKMEFMEKMKAERGVGNGGMMKKARGGMMRLTGNVIALDENSLTVEIEDGGSKLVFYSDNTMILEKRVTEE